MSLLVPGGASTVNGDFPHLAASLGTQATVIQVAPPGIGATSDRRPLRLAIHARALSQAVRRTGDNPDVVVGYSLGGLGRVAAGGRQPRSGRPHAIAGSDPADATADAAVDGGVLQAVRCLGPVGRHQLVVAVVSYAGQLDLTAVADRDGCPDVEVFARGVRSALDDLARSVLVPAS